MSLPRFIRKNPRAFGVTVFLLLLIFIAVGLAIFRNPSPPESNNQAEEPGPITEHLKKGQEYYQKGEYERAKGEFEAALKRNPDLWIAWYGRGQASSALNEFDEQLKYCKTATEFNPNFAPAWNCLGEALLVNSRELVQKDQEREAKEKRQQAIEAFGKASDLFKSNSEELGYKIRSKINKGEALLENEDYQEAVEALETSLALASSNGLSNYNHFAYNLLGRAHREQGSYDKALNDYNSAISEEQYYYPAQIGKGLTLNSLGKTQEALDTFNQVLINQNKYNNFDNFKLAEVWFYKGLVLEKLNQCKEAIDAYEKATEYRQNYQPAEEAKLAAQNRCR